MNTLLRTVEEMQISNKIATLIGLEINRVLSVKSMRYHGNYIVHAITPRITHPTERDGH